MINRGRPLRISYNPNNIYKYSIAVLLMISGIFRSSAQVTISPATATSEDSVTILFNAAEGNAALAGYTGPVFMHTGLITPASTGPGDWYDVVDSWGTVDSNTLMTPLGGNLYSKKIFIPAFYGIDCSVIADSLAFVFRNADGSIVGRDSSGNNIFAALTQPAGTYIPGNYISHTVTGNKLQVISNTGVVTLRVFQSGISVLQQGDTTTAVDSSYAIVDTMLVPVNPAVANDSLYLSFSYDANHTVLIRKFPMGVMLLRGTDTIFAEQPGWTGSACGGAYGTFRIQSGEAFFGGGSRSGNVNLRGNYYQLNNQAHGGYGNGTLNLNISIPFFVSSKGYGILFDNQYIGSADIGSTDSSNFTVNFTGGPMRYFLVPGNSYKQIAQHYTASTGRQDLPPMWAMGYIQSKYGYQSAAEADSVVSQMQAQDFPISGLVLDLYWFGGTARMGNLDWDNAAFPNHNEMIASFLDSGVKTVVITEPYFTLTSSNYDTAAAHNYFSTNSTGAPYVIGGFWAGDASLLDITKPAAQAWFWQFYQQRINDGISGFWSDLGEPETDLSDMYRAGGSMNETHNIFALLWERTIYNGYKQHYPGVRMFNISRSGYAGMQRYSTFPWSGDVARSFSGMQAQIPIMINMGMSGVGYMHNDIGGFTNGPQNDELYTRWQQMGAFAPVERVHGSGVPTAPIDYPVANQEIIRSFTKLRMSMLPYNYTLAWQNATMGTPLVRGIFYEDSGFSQQGIQVNDEYLFGPNILVAPVMQAGATSRSVTFPSGDWFSWWDASHYTANTTATIAAPLTTMPLFIRGDALLPTTAAVNSTIHYDSKTLLVHYFPADTAKTADFTAYFDDGINSDNLATGNYKTMHFTAKHGQAGNVAMWLDLSQQGTYAGEPETRSLTYIIHNVFIPAADSVLLTWAGGSSYLQNADAMTTFNSSDSVYFYDATSRTLYAKYTTNYDSARLEIKYESLALSVPLVAQPNNLQVYPNPFKEKTNIAVNLASPGTYTLMVYDMNGRELYRRAANLNAGQQLLTYDGSSLAPGTYIISLSGKDHSWQQRVTLTR
jgi:alpha-glucosidase (family GH31 glycosyl hydrolase)